MYSVHDLIVYWFHLIVCIEETSLFNSSPSFYICDSISLQATWFTAIVFTEEVPMFFDEGQS